MADLRISQLPPLTGAILQADDALPIVDVSASETKKVTSKDLVQSGIALIDDGSIPSEKFNYTVPAGSIGTTELADGSVTAPKLADNSTAVYADALPASGAYQGQLAVLSTDGMAYIWSAAVRGMSSAPASHRSLAGKLATSPQRPPRLAVKSAS